MAKVSVDVPDLMKKKLERLAEENLYTNTSEYIRDALRERIEADSELSPREKEVVAERKRKLEEGETEPVSKDEARKKLGIE
ncbi:MAG: ribbon-helix-helix domain-containing protein [Candidatus Nanohaloarchaea archaeon]